MTEEIILSTFCSSETKNHPVYDPDKVHDKKLLHESSTIAGIEQFLTTFPSKQTYN